VVSHRIAVPAVFAAGLTLFGASVAGAQPGITAPAPEAQGQSGVTSAAPTPPPAPEPAPSALAAVIPDAPVAPTRPKPQYLAPQPKAQPQPVTPQRSAPQVAYSEPTYTAPQGPVVVAPRVDPPAPIAAPPDTVRIGSFEAARPAELPKDATDKVNAWSAFFESKIASGYDAAGVPPEESDRRAASTVAGAVSAGAVGAVTAGVPAAVAGGVVGCGVGALVGAGVATIPTLGVGTLPAAGVGCLVGAGVGAAGAGAVGAAAGGAAAGAAGGLVGNTLGSDPVPDDVPAPPALFELPPAPDPVVMVSDAVEWVQAQPAAVKVITVAESYAADVAPQVEVVVNDVRAQVAAQPGGAELVAGVEQALAGLPVVFG